MLLYYNSIVNEKEYGENKTHQIDLIFQKLGASFTRDALLPYAVNYKKFSINCSSCWFLFFILLALRPQCAKKNFYKLSVLKLM